jgi:multicomponent Na+:H+ antiporter subunit G
MRFQDLLCAFFLVVGAGFVLLAGLGIVRFPDLFMRMQASTKASTLGVGGLMLAVAVFYMRVDVTARSMLILVFIFLTAPVAAHMIARAAYLARVPLWEKTIIDDLELPHEKWRQDQEEA